MSIVVVKMNNEEKEIRNAKQVCEYNDSKIVIRI